MMSTHPSPSFLNAPVSGLRTCSRYLFISIGSLYPTHYIPGGIIWMDRGRSFCS